MIRRLSIVLAVGLTAVMVAAATLPEGRRSLIDTRGPLHPYVHVAAFTLIAWLSAWTTRSTGVRVALCVAVALVGCGTELLEWRMYQNPLEWADMVLDAMGAVGGMGLGALLMPRERSARHRFADDL